MNIILPLLMPLLGQPQANPQYLDPGSGSIVIQVLLAALLGGAYAIRVYWKKIKQLFTRSRHSEPADQEQNPDEK